MKLHRISESLWFPLLYLFAEYEQIQQQKVGAKEKSACFALHFANDECNFFASHSHFAMVFVAFAST